MAHEPLRHLIRSLGKLSEQAAGTPSDAQLLERFATQRDEAAFELLLWRHGPMVLGVCTRVLGKAQDAEDAFQITFLALVRKAGSVTRGEAVGTWLFQVAYRAALRLRAIRAKQAGRDHAGVPEATEAPDDAPADELRQALDEEINRLPARQRAAFVLCCLEGKTGEEASRLLGCPPGTVSSRLTRARQRLRGRLLRRGFVPAAALIAGLGHEALAAPLPPSLVGAVLTIGAGVPSAEILSHVQGVLRAMLLNQLKKTAFLVAALGILIAGGMVGYRVLQAQPTGAQDLPAPAGQVGQPAAGNKDAKGPSAAEVQPKPGPLDRAIDQRCRVTAFQQVDVVATVPGIVKSARAELGDRVKKGDVLVVIDAPLLELEHKLAGAAVQQAMGQVREAEAALAVTKAEVQLANNMADEGVRKTKVAQAAAALETARFKVNVAEIALEKAQHLLSLAKLVSPVDGIVTQRNIHAGDFVRPGEQGGWPLLTVQRTDVLRVVIDIPERNAPAIKVGDPVTLSFDALPGVAYKIQKIARVGFAVDPNNHTMRVEIDVPNPEQRLRPGMTGTATLESLKGPAAVNPPAAAGPGAGDMDTAAKKALLEAARKVYEFDAARARNGEAVGAEDSYRWSHRWLEAQRDLTEAKAERVTAHRDHLERMKALENRTKALADAGQGRPSDAAAGRYYRIQAELWLEQAKAK
jgi:RND family efflux transporter MFP subunit